METSSYKYTNLTASAQIKSGAGIIYGFIVNSTDESGSLKLWDSLTEDDTVIMNTYKFPAGSSCVTLPTGGANFYTGLYATISGTADVTILWK